MNERIPILYDMTLRPEWIDYALDQWVQNPNEQEHRRVLRAYLHGRVVGTEAAIKTVSQLQRNVGPRSLIAPERLQGYYCEMTQLPPDQRTPIRLEILEASTPFFADVLSALRKLDLMGRESVSSSQLYERLAAKYGDRETVRRRIGYVLRTLFYLGLTEWREKKWYLTAAFRNTPAP